MRRMTENERLCAMLSDGLIEDGNLRGGLKNWSFVIAPWRR